MGCKEGEVEVDSVEGASVGGSVGLNRRFLVGLLVNDNVGSKIGGVVLFIGVDGKNVGFDVGCLLGISVEDSLVGVSVDDATGNKVGLFVDGCNTFHAGDIVLTGLRRVGNNEGS